MNNYSYETIELKKHDLIEFKILYSYKQNRIGIVTSIETDLNFSYMVSILTADLLEIIPYGIIEYKILWIKNITVYIKMGLKLET